MFSVNSSETIKKNILQKTEKLKKIGNKYTTANMNLPKLRY